MAGIKNAIFLVVTFASFILLVIMPFQLYAVYRASDAVAIEVEVVHSRFGKDSEDCWVELEFKELFSDRYIEVGDAQPGDIATCSSKKSQVKYYSQGDITTIYLTSNGYYFLNKGSYQQAFVLGALGFLWCVFLFFLEKRKKMAAVKT